MSATPATVSVVDDDRAVREALADFLRAAGFDVRVFHSATDFLLQQDPDNIGCLVLDVTMPGMTGLELQQELIRQNVRVPTIFITGQGTVRMSVQAIKAGAVEFLTKPVDHAVLLNAIEKSIEKVRAEFQEKTEVANLRKKFDSLTAREREVMQLVIAGLVNKQIAAELGLSEVTVKIHRGSAMHKMEAGSLAELVCMAERLDLRAD